MKSSIFMRLICLTIILVSLTTYSFPQDCYWAAVGGGSDFDGGRSIVSDKSGNIYVAGNTNSNPCFFPNDTIADDPFLIKYNSSGVEEWLLEIKTDEGTNYDDESSVACVVLDTLRDQLLLVGSFNNYLKLKDTAIYMSGSNIFILKVNPDGSVSWVKTAGGEGVDRGYGITYDDNGNIYICGSNSMSASFDQTTIPRGGYIAKYDANGNVIWAKNKFRYYSPSQDPIYPYTEAPPKSIIYSNNTLFINGSLINDTIIIDTTVLIFPPDFGSSYIASFDTSGKLEWIRDIGGPHGSCGFQFSIDHSQNLYITGLFYGNGIFGNDTLKAPGYFDGFLTKYNLNGQMQWVTQTNATQTAWAKGVSLVSNRLVYIGGYFSGTMHFNNTFLTSITNLDIFLAGFSLDGNFIGVNRYGHGDIIGITTDEQSNIIFTGYFEDTLSIGSNTFISHGGEDFFTAKCSSYSGGIESPHTSSDQLLIYANPTSGICNITIPENLQHETDLTLFIYDGTGKLIQKIPVHFDQDKITINIKDESKGIYNALLTNGKKNYTGKIIFN